MRKVLVLSCVKIHKTVSYPNLPPSENILDSLNFDETTTEVILSKKKQSSKSPMFTNVEIG